MTDSTPLHEIDTEVIIEDTLASASMWTNLKRNWKKRIRLSLSMTMRLPLWRRMQ